MLTDFDIRNSLINQIKKDNHKKNYRILEELVICDGSSRIDIAVANGKLLGYEIKSDYDTLDRLDNQIKYYNKTFENITIIVGKKFEQVILEYVPTYWGVSVAYRNKFGNVTIKRIRASKVNKNLSKPHLLDLLWNHEIKLLLKQYNITGYSREKRAGLKNMAIENLSLNDIKKYTIKQLKTRTGWRDF